MTQKRPIELVNASKACADAWQKRDAMIDAGDKEGVKAMDLTCDLLQERYNSLYRQWQALGGTSNIDSIAFPPQFVDGFCDPRYNNEDIAISVAMRNVEICDPANKEYFQKRLDEEIQKRNTRTGFQQW